MAPIITANIVDGLARVAPEQRAAFEQGRHAFLAKLEPAMAEWAQTMAPFKGAKLVVDHSQWSYFFARYGLVLAGTVEERPGIPPDARPSRPPRGPDEGGGREGADPRALG